MAEGDRDDDTAGDETERNELDARGDPELPLLDHERVGQLRERSGRVAADVELAPHHHEERVLEHEPGIGQRPVEAEPAGDPGHEEPRRAAQRGDERREDEQRRIAVGQLGVSADRREFEIPATETTAPPM